MPRAFFVAGTDTGVGKTLVATVLLEAARARGLRTIGLKPLASGAMRQAGGLRNADALALGEAMSEPLDYAEINPVALEPAIAPHLAAAEAGVRLDAAALAAQCRQVLARPHDFAVVEGAGGWRVPLNGAESLASLARQLGFPVLLVVGMRLGCINHALLSAEAIRRDGLPLAGWIASQPEPAMDRLEQNLESIDVRIEAPRLGFIPYSAAPSARELVHTLDMERLLRG